MARRIEGGFLEERKYRLAAVQRLGAFALPDAPLVKDSDEIVRSDLDSSRQN
jgi:hypothetical protein